jgi:small subunit ribosomal protein S8e
MGITRSSLPKRRLTGGKKPQYHKKRKYEMGRQMAMTKIGAKRVHQVRCRGGSTKFRALRLDTGNFSWGSETCTRKTRILDVVYNASNNELVRTKTLVKNAIVQIDATYVLACTACACCTACSCCMDLCIVCYRPASRGDTDGRGRPRRSP